jgi:predicted transcriptional regulator
MFENWSDLKECINDLIHMGFIKEEKDTITGKMKYTITQEGIKYVQHQIDFESGKLN